MRPRVHLQTTRLVRGDVPQPETGYGTWTRIIDDLLATTGKRYIEVTWPGDAYLLRHGLAMAAKRRGRTASVRQIRDSTYAVTIRAPQRRPGGRAKR